MTWNTLNEIKRTSVKPLEYLAVRADDGVGYNLLYAYIKPKKTDDYSWLQTARGERKTYMTLEALLKDVSQIDPGASVHLLPTTCSQFYCDDETDEVL